MPETLAEQIEAMVARSAGLTDREITDRIIGPGQPQQEVNRIARGLASRGRIARRRRPDGRIGNYLASDATAPSVPTQSLARQVTRTDGLTEDQVKLFLDQYLTRCGWTTRVAWGHRRGVDIDAERAGERWLIEVKGSGSRPEMRLNYFIGMLGELLQRMDDPSARYSIALPDMPPFRRLWEHLPDLAKRRVQVSALFVQDDGSVIEVA